MGYVVTQTQSFINTRRAFQTLGQAFDFLLRLLKLARVCFETSTQPSVLLERVYGNQVCKKSIGV